jgi:hypothetical protein
MRSPDVVCSISVLDCITMQRVASIPEEEWVTLRNQKLRTGDGEKLGLTVDLSKLFDQLGWLWDYQALSRLP